MVALLGLVLLAVEPGVVEPLATPPASLPAAPGAAPAPALPPAAALPPPLESREPRKNYLLATLETAFIFGVGTVWYWDTTWYSKGWDLRFTWPDWGAKFDLNAVRFDADRFDTNAKSHPRAGVYYYQAARGNGLGFFESYLWVFATSVIWEYGVEFNEFPSINDMIFTPQGGVAVGEPTYRLGRFFDAGSPTFANRLGALLFSPFSVIDDWASGRRQPRGPVDEWGFPRAFDHRFAFALDGLASELDGQRAFLESFAIDTALVSHLGYRRPGHGWETVAPGEWTELGVRLLYGQHGGMQGFDLHSSTLVAGRYFRDYDELVPDDVSRRDNLRGWGAMLGLGTAFDYTSRDLAAAPDKVASMGVLGPMLEIASERGRAGVRFSLQTYYAFAQVDSLVYAADGDPLTSAAYELPTPLHQQGYYFGQGLSSLSTLVARLGDVELSLMTSLAAYWSINFRDRYQESLHNELSVSDTRASGAVTASYKPGGGPVRLSARVEHYERTGELQGKSAVSLETRAGVGVAFVF
ncbi:MAG TPA: DUF3943 domain-containing protein [Polyangia bacterium]|nr:DUF3943 domain-containing protein [Polyangia bacterium]